MQTNKFHKLLLVLVYNIPPVTWWKVVNISPCNPEGVYVLPLRRQMGVAGTGAGFIPRTGGGGEVTSQTFIHTITFLLFLPWGTFNLLSQAQVHPTRRIKVPHRLYLYLNTLITVLSLLFSRLWCMAVVVVWIVQLDSQLISSHLKSFWCLLVYCTYHIQMNKVYTNTNISTLTIIRINFYKICSITFFLTSKNLRMRQKKDSFV